MHNIVNAATIKCNIDCTLYSNFKQYTVGLLQNTCVTLPIA